MRTPNRGSSTVYVTWRGGRGVQPLPILTELEGRRYQRELLRDAEAERRRAQLRTVAPLTRSNPVVGLARRFVVAFVALLHQRAA
jgi:hypothetical protein